MSAGVGPDPYAAGRALRATGRLAAFNAAGVLTAADVHVANRVGALAGEGDDAVLLALALTVRGTRAGSVVLDLTDAADTVAPEALDGAGIAGSDPAAAQAALEELIAALPWPDPQAWAAACAASPLTAGPAGPSGRPLRMDGNALWLDRYFGQEREVAESLLARAGGPQPAVDQERLAVALARLFPAEDDADQRLAAAVAVLSPLTVIAGGPGTGKTTTLARLLALLADQPGTAPRVALAAPTGKAAARLTEAVRAAVAGFEAADRDGVKVADARTIHRLLGYRPGTLSRFAHDRDNRLPYEVVIIDETSMVPLTLMARLLEALRPATRLVLVGDPDQLASVEAGAVLGDIVGRLPAAPGSPARSFRGPAGLADVLKDPRLDPAAEPPGPGQSRLRDVVVTLERTRRFDAAGAIAALAAAVRDGEPDVALALLRCGDDAIELVEVADDAPVPEHAVAGLRADVVDADQAMTEAAVAGDAARALDALERHRVLCGHRSGPRGDRSWTDRLVGWLAADRPVTRPVGRYAGDRYVGEPVLITANDRELELFNGDTGVVVAGPDGEPVVAFRRGAEIRLVPTGRLPEARPVYAMTVHRSQGSEFARVSVVLPPAGSPLTTRQTLYTAITRARLGVRLIGSAAAIERCVTRPAARASGLGARLTVPPPS